MTGSEIIEELSRRSTGRWNPTAGDVYPTLQLLEDEALVTSRQSADGKRRYELTDAGREESSRVTGRTRRKPWEPHGETTSDLFVAIGETARVLLAAATLASEEQRAQIVGLLEALRERLTAIVPEAESGPPFVGWSRGPWSRPGSNWPFGFPGWFFGGGAGPFGSPPPWWPRGGGEAHGPDRDDGDIDDEDDDTSDV